MPFLFTTVGTGESDATFYEWDVDPYTRQPAIPQEDIEEIAELLSDDAERVVFQNAKFDVKVLAKLGVWEYIDVWKFWNRVEDTLIKGHLLASNEPHDLTSMVLIYLGVNIKHFEDRIDEATKAARRLVKHRAFIETYGEWRIAKEGLPEMPSAKGGSDKESRGEDKSKLFKYDMWLPRTVCRLAPEFLPSAVHLDGSEWHPGDDIAEHPWWTVCSDYANADSSSTLPLAVAQDTRIQERGLDAIYRERLKVLPVAYRMEQNGVTLSGERLNSLVDEYKVETTRRRQVCVNIAKGYGYDLEMPAGASVNNSLRTFFWETLGLEQRGQKNKELSRKNPNPSLDKNVLEHYEATLPANTPPVMFVKALRGSRSMDTAVTYMEGYRKFWIHEGGGTYRLYPSLNPTGTDTLRTSSSNPNAQNISKKEDFNLRCCFGPEPGYEWWSLDYQNIELRIPAYESGEKIMIDLFEKPDDPPYFGSYHLMNASIIYPDLFWPLADQKGAFKKKYAATWYQWCKNFGFAVGYGAMEASGTADIAAHKPGAQRMVMDRLKEHSKLNQKMIDMAERYGYVETIPDLEVDPTRGYPLLCSRSTWGSILPTVPLNYHVQGTACWVAMRAMILIQEYFDELNKRLRSNEYQLILNVHDEVVLRMPYRENKGNWTVVQKCKTIMERLGKCISVPLTVGVEYHKVHWAEGETVYAS